MSASLGLCPICRQPLETGDHTAHLPGLAAEVAEYRRLFDPALGAGEFLGEFKGEVALLQGCSIFPLTGPDADHQIFRTLALDALKFWRACTPGPDTEQSKLTREQEAHEAGVRG